MQRFLDLTQSFLSRSECRLLTANTGLEAIKVVRSEMPDLVVLDIEMPEMNGIEACRILKSDPATRKIPVVMLTSLSAEAEARRAGADHFLQKPIDEERFLREIRKFLPLVERADPRVAVDLPARAAIDGKDISLRVVDLSKGGAFLSFADPLPDIGDQFPLAFDVPVDGGTKTVLPRAIVVRRIEGKGIAVRFFELSSGGRLFLEEFLARPHS